MFIFTSVLNSSIIIFIGRCAENVSSYGNSTIRDHHLKIKGLLGKARMKFCFIFPEVCHSLSSSSLKGRWTRATEFVGMAEVNRFLTCGGVESLPWEYGVEVTSKSPTMIFNGTASTRPRIL